MYGTARAVQGPGGFGLLVSVTLLPPAHEPVTAGIVARKRGTRQQQCTQSDNRNSHQSSYAQLASRIWTRSEVGTERMTEGVLKTPPEGHYCVRAMATMWIRRFSCQ